MPPPPGSSPAAAAHRPRGLPAGRSRVRGMSVCRRRPPAGLVGQRLSGSCGAAHPECEGWGQSRGPGEGSLGAVLRSRENRSEDPPGKPRPGGGLGTKHRRGPESRPQAARGSLPGGARRRAARRALAAPRARGLRSRRRGFPGAGSAPAHRLARRHRGTRLGLVARRGRAEGLVSGRAESFAH